MDGGDESRRQRMPSLQQGSLSSVSRLHSDAQNNPGTQQLQQQHVSDADDAHMTGLQAEEYLARVQNTLLSAVESQIETLQERLVDSGLQLKEVDRVKSELFGELTRTKLDLGSLNAVVSKL